MQAHHLPVRLPYGEQSEVLWALAPKGTAVIFVHGFGGGATSTWVQFPSLLQQERSCNGHDLFFYGYDGLRIRAAPNADLLVKLLDTLFGRPAELVKSTLPSSSRPQTFKYKKAVIVAHSLGAIVSRLALVRAHRERRTWAKKIDLVLFAPAHGGASILPLASLAMGALRLAPIEEGPCLGSTLVDHASKRKS